MARKKIQLTNTTEYTAPTTFEEWVAIHGEPEKVEAMRELLLEYGAPAAYAPVPGQTYEFG